MNPLTGIRIDLRAQVWPMPRIPLTAALERMAGDFGWGAVLPYRVLLVAPPPALAGAVLRQVRGGVALFACACVYGLVFVRVSTSTRARFET